MILKDYQKNAINDLENFLELVDKTNSLSEAYKKFWALRDVPAKPPYTSTIANVPQVCFKVPTGGGKTFMAAASLQSIFMALPAIKTKVVVWLVPSDTILSQTYKNLNNPDHPYRQRLQIDFSDRVAVYNKEQLLMAQNFSPVELLDQLSILVLSYDSFRTSNKEGRKAYQENGQLLPFVSHFKDDVDLLPDADITSLINVIRQYQPVIIIDESHHATTKLSIEMLQNFNPSFVLELTATPKENSNIISYVPAFKLKAANMVKLPVIVYNRHSREEVIGDAINLQHQLEIIANNEEMKNLVPVRPIVLFQAEPKGKGDRATFDKIKSELIQNYRIPPEQIAIKTADINDLPDDLMAADCPIRFIITINALKEGWDCPFAYILASLANRSSAVDVEQILGRILRRPYTKQFQDSMLNMSYVFTASENFRQTLLNIVKGLNNAGFSEHDYRTFENIEQFPTSTLTPLNLFPTSSHSTNNDKIDVPAEETSQNSSSDNNNIISMINQARNLANDYDNQFVAGANSDRAPEERDKMTEFPMQSYFIKAQEILLPQFFTKVNAGSLFGDETEIKISKKMLRKKFSLKNKDTEIDFDHLDLQIMSVDVYENEDFPRYKKLSEGDSNFLLEHISTLPLDSQINQCAGKIYNAIDKHTDILSRKEIKDYIHRIVSNFDKDRIFDALKHTSAYIRKIDEKINSLMNEYAHNNFMALIDSKQIFAKPSYSLPQSISPTNFTKNIVKSLYVAESDDMNNFEHKVITEIASLDNIRWWHRNRERKDFCINGFINHYPDFLVMTNSGILLLIETKGDDRDNSDSKRKLELGKLWESKAGSDKFSYFMVFDKKPINGALSFHDFISRIKVL